MLCMGSQVMRANRLTKLLLHSFHKCLQGDWCVPGITVALGYVNDGAPEHIPIFVLMVFAVYTVKNCLAASNYKLQSLK